MIFSGSMSLVDPSGGKYSPNLWRRIKMLMNLTEWYSKAKEESVSRYKEGEPISKLSKELKVSYRTIRKWLEEEGVEVKRGRPKEKSNGGE